MCQLVCKNIEECKNYECWLLICITIIEPVIERIGESISEPVSESISEPVSEPISESISEPVSESISEPVSEPICKHEWKFSMLEPDSPSPHFKS